MSSTVEIVRPQHRSIPSWSNFSNFDKSAVQVNFNYTCVKIYSNKIII